MTVRHLALLAALALSPAFAAAAQPAPTPVIPTLSDLELDRLRGGFLTAGDVKFEFGAEVRTYAEGALALRTNVTWTAAGAKIDQQSGGAVRPTASADSMRSAINGAEGSFRTADGAAIIHQVTEGRLANFLINAGSNQTFRQETDVTLTLPGFAQVQDVLSRQLLGARLNADIAAGALRASR